MHTPEPLPARPIEALILDRDGTVIEDRHYLHDPDEVRLLPGAAAALAQAAARGVRLFVVTNQSGIGRGYFSLADYQATDARLRELLAAKGVALSDSVFCPHAPDAACACRKPGLGLWNELATRHGLSPSRTMVIGDKRSDVAFGQAFGAGLTALVLTGHGPKQAAGLGLALPGDRGFERLLPRAPGRPDILARDLGQALSAAGLTSGPDPLRRTELASCPGV